MPGTGRTIAGFGSHAAEVFRAVQPCQEAGEPLEFLAGAPGAVAHQVPNVQEALCELVAGPGAGGGDLLDEPILLQAG